MEAAKKFHRNFAISIILSIDIDFLCALEKDDNYIEKNFKVILLIDDINHIFSTFSFFVNFI